MTLEEDVAVIKNDIQWIKKELGDMKEKYRINRGYIVAIIGSVLIATSSLVVVLVK